MFGTRLTAHRWANRWAAGSDTLCSLRTRYCLTRINGQVLYNFTVVSTLSLDVVRFRLQLEVRRGCFRMSALKFQNNHLKLKVSVRAKINDGENLDVRAITIPSILFHNMIYQWDQCFLKSKAQAGRQSFAALLHGFILKTNDFRYDFKFPVSRRSLYLWLCSVGAACGCTFYFRSTTTNEPTSKPSSPADLVSE